MNDEEVASYPFFATELTNKVRGSGMSVDVNIEIPCRYVALWAPRTVEGAGIQVNKRMTQHRVS